MIKNQQHYRGLVLGVIGLTILVFESFIYNSVYSLDSIHQSETKPQTQPVDSPLNGGYTTNAATSDAIVNAKDYEQFWIWTPPKDDTKLSQAHTLYILQGEIRPNNIPYYHSSASDNRAPATLATLTPQGLGVRSLSDKKIWLVYRATSQEWSDEVMAQLIERLEKWQRAGNQVMGIQIDYDAPTYQLDKYAQLLESIRQQLPAQYHLSVTGLLDWSNQAEKPQFMQLNDAVDELIVQTYQGTTTLTNYSRYLKRLENLPFDFKIGVIEGGQWQGADFLENNPHFKGYVVFLR
ncbi:MAG: DUF3142 domain-containing protein [Psychrobacter sp.]|uniref:DUF3142 domain-containing protein n=1 Tax=Psychrobacter sp. AOP7-B1-24 TaxID=3457645 RepID=UPI003FB711D3